MTIKNITLYFLIFNFLILSISCKQESEHVINAFYLLDESLVETRLVTDHEINRLKEKFYDYEENSVRTDEMKPKMRIATWIVDRAETLSKKIIPDLNVYRNNIISRSGDIVYDTRRIEYAGNKEAAKEIMIDKGGGKKMMQKLFMFKKEMAQLIDSLPSDIKLFDNQFSFYAKLPILEDSVATIWKVNAADYEIFNDISAIGAVTIIDKYINEIMLCNLVVLQELEASIWRDIKVHPLPTNH